MAWACVAVGEDALGSFSPLGLMGGAFSAGLLHGPAGPPPASSMVADMVAILWGISAAAAAWPSRPVSVHSDCQAALTVADGTGVKFFADGLQA
eukprot:6203084-Prorocentrum_lima.AAC.1